MCYFIFFLHTWSFRHSSMQNFKQDKQREEVALLVWFFRRSKPRLHLRPFKALVIFGSVCTCNVFWIRLEILRNNLYEKLHFELNVEESILWHVIARPRKHWILIFVFKYCITIYLHAFAFGKKQNTMIKVADKYIK